MSLHILSGHECMKPAQKGSWPLYLNEDFMCATGMEGLEEQSGRKQNVKLEAIELAVLVEKAKKTHTPTETFQHCHLWKGECCEQNQKICWWNKKPAFIVLKVVL